MDRSSLNINGYLISCSRIVRWLLRATVMLACAGWALTDSAFAHSQASQRRGYAQIAATSPTPVMTPAAITGTVTTQVAETPAPLIPASVDNIAAWQTATPPSSPSARAEMGFVYDVARKVTVAIGGSFGFHTRFPETWEYDDTTWARKFPAQFPSGRDRPAVAYDPARRVSVVFGGSSPADDLFYNDTWEYDGVNWIQKFPLNPPSPRNGATMAYDTRRGKMVLFGGYRWEGRYVFFDETWEYDGAQWKQLFPANRPAARETAAMVYDIGRGKIILFGGGRIAGSVVFSDTWEWDGVNWVRLFPRVSPSARWAHSMAYDQRRQRIVLFGGLTGTTNAFNDTWEFGGNSWEPVSVASAPPARWDHGMAYDAEHDKTILFGGMFSNFGRFGWRNDTWHYFDPQPSPQRPVVLLPGFPGSTLIGRVADVPECSPQDEMHLWLNFALLLDSPDDMHLHRLRLGDNGVTPLNECDEINATAVIYKITGLLETPWGNLSYDKNVYEILIAYLVEQGYSVIPCPYDWRGFLDRDDTPKSVLFRVEQCIELAQNGDPNQQVDIVAHSTGGLIARQYVLSNPDRAAKIHTIVTLGTPYLGTVKAFILLRYGHTLMDIIWPVTLDWIISSDRLIEAAPNWPAVYKLLPSKTYVDRFTYFFKKELGAQSSTPYRGFDMMRKFLVDNYNVDLVEAAHKFHGGGIDDWRSDGLDVNYYIFVGNGIDTPDSVFETVSQRWWDRSPSTDYDFYTTLRGDGTVPLSSATLFSGAYAGDAILCIYQDVKHGELTENPIVLIDLNKALLRGGVPSNCQSPNQVVASATTDDGDSRQLVVKGPGLVHVWDNQGRHAGPISDTLSIENQIPLVTYLGDEGRTFVSLPPVTTYTITIEMSGTTPLDIKLRTIVPADMPEETIAQTVLFQDVPASIGGTATILYNPLADPGTLVLVLDTTGDGVADATLPPTSVLDQAESSDWESPVSQVQIEGETDFFGYYTGPVTVTLTATDTGSGVHQIEYSTDGGTSGVTYARPFLVTAEAVPVLYVQAVDRAGNREYPWTEVRLRPENLPPDGILIQGPAGGMAGGEHVFTATVLPTTTLQPVMFLWEATDWQNITDTGGLTSTVALTWTAVGDKSVHVTAYNAAGMVAGSREVSIAAGAPAHLVLSTDLARVIADGKSNVTVTAVVKDSFGNPTPGATVTWVTNFGQVTAQTVTDAEGVATAILTSTTSVGTAFVDANTGSIHDRITIEFVGSAIRGRVFFDLNYNGIREPDEQGVAGAQVAIAAQNEDEAMTIFSDDAGAYSATNLPPGDYVVTVTAPPGYHLTTTNIYTVTVAASEVHVPDIGMAVLVYNGPKNLDSQTGRNKVLTNHA